MSNFFMAGADLVRWEVTSLGADGPYRLTMHHARGSIVEYFPDTTAALTREAELEDLLIAARGATPPRGGQGMNATPSRVLIIDDDEAVIQTFARMLRFEGHEVRTALDAESGLRQARMEAPDAIIVDLRMPLINGLGFLYRLRSQERHQDTPVAIVTGDYCLDDSITREVDELGAELRYKPLWLEDLVDLAHLLLTSDRRTRPHSSSVAH